MNLELQSAEVKDLFAAISKMQAELQNAEVNAENPFHDSEYANLHAVISASKKALANNGLAVVQGTVPMQAGLVLVTTLTHSSGQFLRSLTPILVNEQTTAQQLGAWITYARRYSWSAIIGLTQHDDDGESAKGSGDDHAEHGEIKPSTRPGLASSLKNQVNKRAAPAPFCTDCGEQMRPSKLKRGEYYCNACYIKHKEASA